MRARYLLYILLAAGMLCACGGKTSHNEVVVNRRPFSGDSAYQYVAAQMDFGPRVPGTEEHDSCVLWLTETLRRFGADVEIQEGTMPDYAGEPQPIRNIVAHIGQDSTAKRILLCAHFDCRPWCDEDEEASWYQPVPGANDGASGVAILLEVARQLQLKPLQRGIDIVLFDCEDMGTPSFLKDLDRQDTWCLGSQLWAKDASLRGRYEWGMLLDMVGAPGATFYREYYSEQQASAYVEKVWHTASVLGYDNYFCDRQAGAIVDDHFYVARELKIPVLDIIHIDPATGTFPAWWHTPNDDMQQIDKATLQAVGEVVMSVL